MIRRIGLVLGMAVAFAGAFEAPAAAQRRVSVNVESTPPGAAVHLDSEDGQLLGTTPMSRVLIPIGNHVLFFKKDGFRVTELPVYVRRRRETFRASLDRMLKIRVIAGNDAAQGAAVRIDGRPVGNVPFEQEVQAGRYLVQVGKEGFVTFSEWVEVRGDSDPPPVAASLEREAPRTGDLLVASDVSGATVTVDGQPRGSTPTLVEGLTEGDHVVVVTSDQPGLQPHQENVRIIASARASVHATLRPAPVPGGSLVVSTNPRGAAIRIDGEEVGTSPVTKRDLPPGEHLVEAQLEGYQLAQVPVTITTGQSTPLAITLTSGSGGQLVVNANVSGATVFVNNEERGSPPVVLDDLDPGTYGVVVRADGYQEFRTTCRVGPGQDCGIDAELDPVGTPVYVDAIDAARNGATVRGAEFYVDGDVFGPVPFEGTIPAGDHIIEVRAPGYQPYRRQVSVQVNSEVRRFNIALTPEGELTPEERAELAAERRELVAEAVAHGANSLPDELTTLDFSLGWPYLAELRLSVGILEHFEGGFGFRTFGRLSEFEARAKAGWRPLRQLSLGGQFRIGGGIGPGRGPSEQERMALPDGEEASDHTTNNFFMSVDAIGSLHFTHAGAFSLWFGFDFYSDRWDWTGKNNNVPACNDPLGEDNLCPEGNFDFERQNSARLRLGGSLELVLSRHWNIFAIFEGVLAGPNRRILGDIFGANIADTKIYGRLGFTYKFGSGPVDVPVVEEGAPEPPPPAPAPAPAPAAEPAPAGGA